ncbi:MAG TPA: GNAT family N-acetyltransferase [Telmatospirillum sp.]|nr:GNAT family N-acetyltransferase [Telmatospirillum sp.]
MTCRICPILEGHIASFRDAVDVVARERRYLAFLEAPPLEEARRFVLHNIDHRYPQFVVLSGQEVVGWCDVIPNRLRIVHAHCGTLGVGLLPAFRGQGIGRRLMERTMDAAFDFGVTRIELTVRETNATAISLYESLGFKREGFHRNSVCIDGLYENLYSMAFMNACSGHNSKAD